MDVKVSHPPLWAWRWRFYLLNYFLGLHQVEVKATRDGRGILLL